VWVSEVMLQQTTVKSVLPYYGRFISRFDSVKALAMAREEDVLAEWSGLGYYHRARNLRRGAQHILTRHDGVFPKTLEAALAVPGVGIYTAGAVLSIAYGVQLPVLDGNVRRVLARLLAIKSRAEDSGEYYNAAEQMLDRSSPGDWNQAMMELGARVCTPRKPSCPVCPVLAQCKARSLGLEESLPLARQRRTPVDVTVAAAVVERGGRVLLVRRREGRLMGRLWEIPQTSLESKGLEDLVPEVRKLHGLDVVPGTLIGRIRHAITFRRISVEAYRTRLKTPSPQDSDQFRWATPKEVSSLPVSSMTKKILKCLDFPELPLLLDRA